MSVGSSSSITEQLGLVSVTGGADLRYLGPSSGVFFTKFVLAALGKRVQVEKPASSVTASDDNLQVPDDLLLPQPKELPLNQKHTRWLSRSYFDTVHLQFPFIHEPGHWNIIEKMYNGDYVTSSQRFQVYLVLAIGASILSGRTKVILSSEGYYATAMELIKTALANVSLDGVQCILLLQMYAFNNPSSGLSLWLLHHHALGLAIELGIHRNVPGSRFTGLETEMRTRAFWCIYAIDRFLSTLMGRPMGIVDEQCDLRFPAGFEDEKLESDRPEARGAEDPPTKISHAIHLFKLARFNSEIKCVLYCVDRQYPPYTQPVLTDAEQWKVDILNRLNDWRNSIPSYGQDGPFHHISLLCEIRYHELVMLVLRPSPRFRNPDRGSLRECFSSALECSKLYYQLYSSSSLQYGWVSVHSLFLCVMVILYCAWAPGISTVEADFSAVIISLKNSSNVLSAMGEHWPEAKRSRDILDHISTKFMGLLATKVSPAQKVAGTQRAQSSAPDPEHPTQWTGLGTDMPPPLFEDETMTDTLFTPSYASFDTSFTSTDILSYFLGSEIDVMSSGLCNFDNVLNGNNSDANAESTQVFDQLY